jgi:pimeloyl-ACP methyl ester carboxylesterase
MTYTDFSTEGVTSMRYFATMTRGLRAALLVTAVLLLALVPAVGAQETITLTPVENEVFELAGVVPEGWQYAAPGVYARAATSGDVTVVALQSAPASLEAVLQSLLPQLGLSEAPEPAGTYETEAFTFTLYQVQVVASAALTLDVNMGLTEVDGRAYIVLLQSAVDETEALYDAVFVPMLDALVPFQPAPVEVDVPYLAEDVTFENGDVTLAGTLTLPDGDGPHPAVVLVTGSGPQDRDESLAPLTTFKPFLDLADALTRAGVAVLRYDDRGVAQSTGDFAAATLDDFVTDAAAAIEYLKGRPEINTGQIGMLGHSEGGYVAARLGATNPDVAFLIAMAGPGASGADVLLVQNERILRASDASDALIQSQLDMLNAIFPLVEASDWEAVEQVIYDTAIIQYNLLTPEEQAVIGEPEPYANMQTASFMAGYQTEWFRTFLTYDPAPDWAQTTVPVLAILGELDTQVDADQNAPLIEAALTEAGNEDFEIVVLEGANHLFQKAETGSPQEYGALEAAYIDGFLSTIVDWLTARVDVVAVPE